MDQMDKKSKIDWWEKKRMKRAVTSTNVVERLMSTFIDDGDDI